MPNLSRFKPACALALTLFGPVGCLDDELAQTGDYDSTELESDDPFAAFEAETDAPIVSCTPGSYGGPWEPDSCNACFCTESGLKCTRVECDDDTPSARQPAGEPLCGEYELGEMWMEDCNICWCLPEGVQCTLQLCDPHM